MGNERLLRVREGIMKFYKGYERWLVAIAKFLLVIFALTMINSHIGYVELLTKGYIVFAIAILAMMVPIEAVTVLLMAIISGHLMVFNMIIGGISLFVFSVVYFGFIRFYPKQSLMIILIMAGAPLKLHYAIVIVAALFGGLGTLIAICIGLIGVAGGQVIQFILAKATVDINALDLVENLMLTLINTVLVDAKILGSIVVFIGVFSVIYIVRKQAVDYAPYIAIVLGAMIMIFGFGMAVLFLEIEVNLVGIGIGTFIGVVVASGCQMFFKPADYTRVENVQYEDEENYYFVKIVPKLKVDSEVQKVEQIFTTNDYEETEAQ